MKRSAALMVALCLASCQPVAQTGGGAIEGELDMMGGQCPAVETAAPADLRQARGSAVALDTCLKSQQALLDWTFSSSLGQSANPTFRVWKAASPTNATAGSCTRVGPGETLTVSLYGTGRDRTRIAGLVDSCLAQVAQDGM